MSDIPQSIHLNLRSVRPKPRHLAALLSITLVSVMLGACGGAKEPAPELASWPEPIPAGGGTRLDIPPFEAEPIGLEERAAAQQATVDQFDVPWDFRFEDRRQESGITFRNRIVDDLRQVMKAVHYDHGNAVAVADVDGDDLLDLYFTTQVGANELWRNRGDGTFENLTEGSGVDVSDRISVAAAFGDIDNDGDQDLFVTTVKMGNLLFENDGSGRFTDISEAAGVDHVGHSSGAVFFDYNGDGLLDLYLTNIGIYTTSERGAAGYFVGVLDAFQGHLYSGRHESGILYENLGDNRFADVTEQAGLTNDAWSGDASAVDLNDDNLPDLYLLNMQGHDEYYQNNGDGTFARRSRELFPKTSWGAMGIKSFDYDRDGDMDLILTDMHSDMSEEVDYTREKLKSDMKWDEEMLQSGGNSIFGNSFFRNDGDDRFSEVSDELNTENFWPWGLSVGDLNADGWEDVFYAASMSYPYRYGINSVLLNNRGERFLDAEFLLGIEPRSVDDHYIPWFNLDCAGAEQHHLHCEGQSGLVTVHGVLGTRAAVMFDLEGDGDLDIVTLEFNHHPQVLINDLSERGAVRYLEIALEGTASNRNGLGAKVEVVTSEGTQTRIHDGKSGYLAQSVQPLYFGLGDSATIERVAVRWPSGVEQELTAGIPESGRLEIVEPAPTRDAVD